VQHSESRSISEQLSGNGQRFRGRIFFQPAIDA